MGQRSQIYVRIKNKGKTDLIAKYFQWNYAERMISRARYGIEWIKENLEYLDWEDKKRDLKRILEVNFDMKDVMSSVNLVEEYNQWIEKYDDKNESMNNSDGFKEFVFISVDNNDGKLFVDVDIEKKTVKFCLTDDELNILPPKDYMNWDYEDWQSSEYLSDDGRKACQENIKYLENVEQLSDEDLQDFINYDYWLDMNKPSF